uniref:Uncharacterized protein LOC8269823 n=1 Tax=Rhizophora mucronata TaxID=61149 RepID=A0A2P2QRB6_RHIMU
MHNLIKRSKYIREFRHEPYHSCKALQAGCPQTALVTFVSIPMCQFTYSLNKFLNIMRVCSICLTINEPC